MSTDKREMLTRREGFAHQKHVVLPESVLESVSKMNLLRGLVPVAAGFFPSAERHLVERPEPLADTIVILCVSGRGWVRIGDGSPVSVEANTLVFIPPGKPHAYGADDAEPWSIYWVHMRGDEAAGFRELFSVNRHNPTVRLPRGVAKQSDFPEIYERLEEDYTLPNLLSAAARLRVVLAELNRMRVRYSVSAGGDPVGRTILWMRAHLEERAELPRLAKKAGMSVPHYSAMFRRKTGYSPVDYFLRMKVQHACRLLDTTTMRVEEISAAVGYEDPFYFSRLFRRVMTKSPRSYRAAPKG